MRISKLRVSPDRDGFVPMGAYFECLARDLAAANARQAALDEEDRRLERRYRRRNAKPEAGLGL